MTGYWVSDKGSDIKGDGTPEKPWATIGYAVSQIDKIATAPTESRVFLIEEKVEWTPLGRWLAELVQYVRNWILGDNDYEKKT